MDSITSVSLSSRTVTFGLTIAAGAAITAVILWQRIKKPVWIPNVAKIHKLVIYPIKSVPGVEVDQLTVTKNWVTNGSIKDR
jgi:dUTPase